MSVKMKQKRVRGFSLIEVLIALVILSIGMMGVGALFVTSLRDSGSAILRTRAINFAEDMADRIRANSAAGASYVATAVATGSNSPACADSSAGGTFVAASSCTSAELAAYDIYTWKTALKDSGVGLPAGNGTIQRSTATTPPTYTITVTWTERDEDFSYLLVFRT